jgi:hypothetical protein
VPNLDQAADIAIAPMPTKSKEHHCSKLTTGWPWLLEIDQCDCEHQDRATADQKLFDFSIDHNPPPPNEAVIRHRHSG